MAQARLSLARDMAADMASEYVAKNPLVTEALMNAGMNLYSSGLDQADELAADRAGTLLAASSGYDPLGLLFVLSASRPRRRGCSSPERRRCRRGPRPPTSRALS